MRGEELGDAERGEDRSLRTRPCWTCLRKWRFECVAIEMLIRALASFEATAVKALTLKALALAIASSFFLEHHVGAQGGAAAPRDPQRVLLGSCGCALQHLRVVSSAPARRVTT